MNRTNIADSPDEFEHDGAGTKSAQADDGDGTNTSSPLSRNETALVVLAGMTAVAVAVAVLRKNPDLRDACRGVLYDAELHEICRDAGDNIYRGIVASWARHGGATALANVPRR